MAAVIVGATLLIAGAIQVAMYQHRDAQSARREMAEIRAAALRAITASAVTTTAQRLTHDNAVAAMVESWADAGFTPAVLCELPAYDGMVRIVKVADIARPRVN